MELIRRGSLVECPGTAPHTCLLQRLLNRLKGVLCGTCVTPTSDAFETESLTGLSECVRNVAAIILVVSPLLGGAEDGVDVPLP